MATPEKKGGSSSEFETDSRDQYLDGKTRSLRMIDGARIGITALALLCGVAILALSADALDVYNTTSLPGDFLLPLWPEDFDLRPTVALVVGSSIIVVANLAALLGSKVPALRNNTPVHKSTMFAAPSVGLAAAIIAMAFFYAINASTSTDTLLSWTCRWTAVSMSQKPYFGAMCRESWASVYLAVVLVPIEAIAVCAAGWQFKLEKHTLAYARARKGSPVV